MTICKNLELQVATTQPNRHWVHVTCDPKLSVEESMDMEMQKALVVYNSLDSMFLIKSFATVLLTDARASRPGV